MGFISTLRHKMIDAYLNVCAKCFEVALKRGCYSTAAIAEKKILSVFGDLIAKEREDACEARCNGCDRRKGV